jgi:hypothetical protein
MKKILILIFFLISNTTEIFSQQSAEVKIFLKNDSLYEGLLISIRDSSILVEVVNILILADGMPITVKKVLSFVNNRISKIIICGKSFKTVGALTGGILGIAINLPGYINPNHYSCETCIGDGAKLFIYTVLSTSVGVIAGYFIGSLFSTDDLIIEPYPNPSIDLHPFARYPDKEPDEIKAIK